MPTLRRLTRMASLPSLIFLLAGSTHRISLAETAAPQRKSANTQKQPRYKAIFEPINYEEDVAFTDVLFVNAKVGWVSGGGGGVMQGGVILHTRDGGDSWAIQVGDLQSSEVAYRELRFADEKHGWAYQRNSNKLLRTTDGETWEQIGALPGHHGDYTFLSATVGVVSTDNKILRTQDAGRTWKEVFACVTKAEVEGLMRNAECSFSSFYFPSQKVGYAIGQSRQVNTAFVAKTEDGGANWKVWAALPGESGKDASVVFTDENAGFVRAERGNFFATIDGGQTWRGITGTVGSGAPEIKFADREAGWAISTYGNFNYTVDGGKRWVVRQMKFPTNVAAFSFPRRDRGYVVGDHGMIYCYRIVPIAYTARGMIEAPMMPGVEASTR